jgi:hypothetical protein
VLGMVERRGLTETSESEPEAKPAAESDDAPELENGNDAEEDAEDYGGDSGWEVFPEEVSPFVWN